MDRNLSGFAVFLLLFAYSTITFAEPLPSSLDPGSAECVSCHQDSITVNEPFEVCHQGGCDHPVGVSYQSFSSRNRGLVPADKLDPAITLVDGKMGCLACHTPYDAAAHETAGNSMLSVDNKGSALCAACHRK
ncbi:hypothetical protein BAC1_01808 [uncultured bacterium]|nr:hypothetical protein BAC1_01808 [uncultured bacterium]